MERMLRDIRKYAFVLPASAFALFGVFGFLRTFSSVAVQFGLLAVQIAVNSREKELYREYYSAERPNNLPIRAQSTLNIIVTMLTVGYFSVLLFTLPFGIFSLSIVFSSPNVGVFLLTLLLAGIVTFYIQDKFDTTNKRAKYISIIWLVISAITFATILATRDIFPFESIGAGILTGEVLGFLAYTVFVLTLRNRGNPLYQSIVNVKSCPLCGFTCRWNSAYCPKCGVQLKLNETRIAIARN
jgi:hypothetical protein